ncbi:hypothetical protein COV93_01065 [Candidatus Woesearchaeota archaeon CG11_big_fil_rev_8_21_14_0_20_43_8]|nr:MAG: hypothetical protein COV93_01065 [Candidatus Woesearchaeota archaeon CG11_big_fil_rev_8_21_14_0_20_43_8]
MLSPGLDYLSAEQQKEMFSNLVKVVEGYRSSEDAHEGEQKLTAEDLLMLISQKDTKHHKKDLHYRRNIGCVVTKSRTPWCRGVCKYDENNIGLCGRLAPHSIEGRTQKAIREYNARIEKKR